MTYGPMSDGVFTWRCGACPEVLAAPDLFALRASVLGHIRAARGRGVTEPRCGHCGRAMSENEASVAQHTHYEDDADPSMGPGCGYVRPMESLVL